MNPDRFHVTLTSAGRPVMQGWWPLEVTARDQLPDARITLVDEETGAVLTEWPEEVRPGVVGSPS